jgi:hypothetical protein
LPWAALYPARKKSQCLAEIRLKPVTLVAQECSGLKGSRNANKAANQSQQSLADQTESSIADLITHLLTSVFINPLRIYLLQSADFQRITKPT